MTGLLRVVRANELTNLTERGWKLKQVLDETEIQHADEYVYVPDPRYGGQGIQQKTSAKPVVLSTHRYLVELDEGSTLAQAAEAAEQSRARQVAEQNRAFNLEKELKQTQETLKEQVKEFQDLSKWHAQLKQELQGEYSQRRKMEVDIGKLRTAIGDLRMREILEQS